MPFRRRRPDPADQAMNMALDAISDIKALKRQLRLASVHNTRASEQLSDTAERRTEQPAGARRTGRRTD